jgi:hypothetical protein
MDFLLSQELWVVAALVGMPMVLSACCIRKETIRVLPSEASVPAEHLAAQDRGETQTPARQSDEPDSLAETLRGLAQAAQESQDNDGMSIFSDTCEPQALSEEQLLAALPRCPKFVGFYVRSGGRVASALVDVVRQRVPLSQLEVLLTSENLSQEALYDAYREAIACSDYGAACMLIEVMPRNFDGCEAALGDPIWWPLVQRRQRFKWKENSRNNSATWHDVLALLLQRDMPLDGLHHKEVFGDYTGTVTLLNGLIDAGEEHGACMVVQTGRVTKEILELKDEPRGKTPLVAALARGYEKLAANFMSILLAADATDEQH